MRIIIAGGGTGGHLYPGIALAKAFGPEAQILFVGTEKGLEAQILSQEGFELAPIRVMGLVGKGRLQASLSVLKLPIALWDSWGILRQFKPDLVMGMGGYVSGPLVFMAGLLGIKRVILEPNVVPGLTNRLLGRWAHRVITAFEETGAYFNAEKVQLIGTPIRPEFSGLGSPSSAQRTLLVIGGSRGAHALNRTMVQALDHMSSIKGELSLIHQTGEADYALVDRAYQAKGFQARVFPYIKNMAEAYEQADLLISRAGATTIAEITAAGKPSVLIPFPYATHGHQEQNARFLESAGAAVVLLEEGLNGRVLAGAILELLRDQTRLLAMGERSRRLGKIHAAEGIVRLCLDLVNR